MWEVLAALSAAAVSVVAAGIVSAGKRSQETHDAVVSIKTELIALRDTVDDNLVDAKERTGMLNMKMGELCARMQRMENDFREYLILNPGRPRPARRHDDIIEQDDQTAY